MLYMYLWSCNQSVAWKCRHWNMLRHKIYWTKSQRNLAKFQNFEKFNINRSALMLQYYFTVSGNFFPTLCLRSHFDYIYFFQFLPLSSRRNTFFPVSSILPGRNPFIPEVSKPCNTGHCLGCHWCHNSNAEQESVASHHGSRTPPGLSKQLIWNKTITFQYLKSIFSKSPKKTHKLGFEVVKLCSQNCEIFHKYLRTSLFVPYCGINI